MLSGDGTSWTFRRVSPGSPESHRIRSIHDAEAGVPPSRTSIGQIGDLLGIWLLQGGDHLLRIGFNDDYAIADQGRLGVDPNDSGTIETDGERTVTFVSGSDSGTCPESTVTEWTDVLVNEDALAASIPPDACGDLPEGRTSWVRISWP